MHKLTAASRMKSWDWKGKIFSVTLAMRLRNLRSSSCAVERKGWECINVHKLCITLLSLCYEIVKLTFFIVRCSLLSPVG